jgi:hypothetical protein
VSGTGMKMVRCLNETCSKFRIAKLLSATLAAKNDLKKNKRFVTLHFRIAL